MSSWYVEQLLLNREAIKDRIIREDKKAKSLDMDYDDDAYSDLLSVEIKLKELLEKNLLDEKQILVIDLILQGCSFSEIESFSGMHRVSIALIFKSICEKLAFLLGEHFTNDGFLNSLAYKYSLSDAEIEKLEEIIN